MNIKHCKICGEAQFGPLHHLFIQMDYIFKMRNEAERRLDLPLAKYYSEREDTYRNEVFNQSEFSKVGFHEFEEEDNLDMIERLANERGIV